MGQPYLWLGRGDPILHPQRRKEKGRRGPPFRLQASPVFCILARVFRFHGIFKSHDFSGQVAFRKIFGGTGTSCGISIPIVDHRITTDVRGDNEERL